ncbi:Prephenate dehydratase [Thermoplasmatales archaeon BRNA1]|nr:Prephenate dehydratase [Thermoplasmatales archaeon BRNA1]
MAKVKVGYMGIPYSNTWEMAKIFAEEAGLDAELVPLVSASKTMEAMEAKEVDFGVFAFRNATAGQVVETRDAIKGHVLEVFRKGHLQIHHCVFTKNADTRVKAVSSHIQALGQCKKNLARLYPDARLMESADTALSAQMLAEGKLPDDTAVICKQAAGEHWGLHLAHINIEDRKDNITDFVMLRIPKSN